jgi:flagellar biogenesis protein FliO
LRLAQEANRDTKTPEVEAESIGKEPAILDPPLLPAPHVDHAVTPAVHEAPAPSPPVKPTQPATSDNRRRLAPPSAAVGSSRDEHAGHHHGHESAATRRLTDFGLPAGSMYKIFTGLAIVVGAFLIFAWALRRGGRTPGRGNVPADVVSVIGRVPLAARQFAELLRVGNKLVLVSLTPNGAQPISEVTDPAEVDRLLGLCQQNNPHSTTKAFEQVFRQLSTETAPGGFYGAEPMPTSFAAPAGAYRAYQRDTRV